MRNLEPRRRRLVRRLRGRSVGRANRFTTSTAAGRARRPRTASRRASTAPARTDAPFRCSHASRGTTHARTPRGLAHVGTARTRAGGRRAAACATSHSAAAASRDARRSEGRPPISRCTEGRDRRDSARPEVHQRLVAQSLDPMTRSNGSMAPSLSVRRTGRCPCSAVARPNAGARLRDGPCGRHRACREEARGKREAHARTDRCGAVRTLVRAEHAAASATISSSRSAASPDEAENLLELGEPRTPRHTREQLGDDGDG